MVLRNRTMRISTLMLAGLLFTACISGRDTASAAEAENAGAAVVINEVDSAPDAWVELKNTGTEDVDLTNYELRDDSDDHRWKFGDGTVIKAGEYLVIDANTAGYTFNDNTTKDFTAGNFDLGLGNADTIRLLDPDGNELDSFKWTQDAAFQGDTEAASYSRIPDGSGEFTVAAVTKGTSNDGTSNGSNGEGAQITDGIDWPGPDTVEVFDKESVFLEDSSGLDFADGKLYAVDNGTAKFWVLDAGKDGSLSFAPGFENGKTVHYRKDADNADAAGPDAEGITVDGDGMVYIVSERDNSDKEVNYDTIEMVDPNEDSADLTAKMEWNLTDTLPKVDANVGTESIEWVSFNELDDRIVDQNTQDMFDPGVYPLAYGGGVFFVGLEDNGHVYGYVLNSDETCVQVLDIDTGAAASGLDYDTYQNILWAYGDDGVNNTATQIHLNGTADPGIVHVNACAGVDTAANNEGFAIAAADYTVDGVRPVYRFQDGVASGALTIGGLYCDFREDDSIPWPGTDEVKIWDTEPTFLQDSSGLDFYNGQLYACDNGEGRFWILDVAKDGTISFADGWENGKRVRFQKDAEDPEAKGPDTEGITVDGNGMVYVSCERDNGEKRVNFDTILMVDPNAEGDDLVAVKEWDLTDSLPEVTANLGTESVEWVSFDEVNGKLYDAVTGQPFDSSNYPNAWADGVFFVGLEENGHVYAYILNDDQTVQQIADIPTGLGAAGIDYDPYEHVLWAASDNGQDNRLTKITLNGTADPEIVHVLPAAGVDITGNNEGFAISTPDYTVDGVRPVFRFRDDCDAEALSINYMNCGAADAQTSAETES